MLVFLLSTLLSLVELNCENLFDCKHDSLKNDLEYTPTGERHWTERRYKRKIFNISNVIKMCGGEAMWKGAPDFVALSEVENDAVLWDLTHSRALGRYKYDYRITDSPDERGINVALLYKPDRFEIITYQSLRVNCIGKMKPTRDILYVSGRYLNGDTIHFFVCHFPSKISGDKVTRAFRLMATDRLCQAIDSIRKIHFDPIIIAAGDFNDYFGGYVIRYITSKSLLFEISKEIRGKFGAKGSYCYKGRWGSFDHIFISRNILQTVEEIYIHDSPFLTKQDEIYDNVKLYRTFNGRRYSRNGISDHLPLVAHFYLKDKT